MWRRASRLGAATGIQVGVTVCSNTDANKRANANSWDRPEDRPGTDETTILLIQDAPPRESGNSSSLVRILDG